MVEYGRECDHDWVSGGCRICGMDYGIYELLQQIADRDARIGELQGVLEQIANKKGHGKMEFNENNIVTGVIKYELSKQCAHWMRHIAKEALSKGGGK